MDRREELRRKLTDKQRVFCHEYILDWNGARAARVAGYSKNGARVRAANLLTISNIREYIDLIKDNIAEEVGISKAGLIKTLKEIAEANIGDIYTSWITRAEFETLKAERPEILGAIQEISTKTETKDMNDELVEVDYVKIKLYDKRLAIQDIFKAMGWNAPEKTETTINGDLHISRKKWVK